MKIGVLGVIAVGCLLLVLSGLWATIFPGTRSWTEEKAAQWSKIQVRLHNLAPIVNNPAGRVSVHSGPDPGEAKQEYDRLVLEDRELAAEFQSAHDSPHTVARILKWSGIAFAVVGIIGWYAVSQSK